MSGKEALDKREAEAPPCPDCGVQGEGPKFCTECGTRLVPPRPKLRAVKSKPKKAEPVVESFSPTPGVRPPSGLRQRPKVHTQGGTRTIHWLGVHGGAGEDTLSKVLPGSVPAGHGWPVLSEQADQEPTSVPVVLVARSHMSGLLAAQDALREWASGLARPANLLGLVIIADIPGRLPKPLASLQKIVGGGAPKFWTLPYLESLRLGVPITTDTMDPELKKFCRAIESHARHA